MKDRELDAILSQAAQASHDVDPALLASIANSVGRSLTPVRPLPPAWALAGGLILISGAVALAGAGRLGLYGIQKMSVLDRALIFPALGLLLWLAATASVAESSEAPPAIRPRTAGKAKVNASPYPADAMPANSATPRIAG